MLTLLKFRIGALDRMLARALPHLMRHRQNVAHDIDMYQFLVRLMRLNDYAAKDL